jgi:FlaA1/EpsC-like NDP-sugar epimerase
MLQRLAAFATRLLARPGIRTRLAALIGLNRYTKRALLAASDGLLLLGAVWVVFSVRYAEFYVPPTWAIAALMFAAPVLTVGTLFGFGIYRFVTRYMGGRTITVIAAAVGLSALLWALLILLASIPAVPRSAPFLYALFGTFLMWGSRQVAGSALQVAGGVVPQSPSRARAPVIIYGAGTAGLQLANALEQSDRYIPVCFVDRSPTLWGQFVGGYKVIRPEKLRSALDREDVKTVMVALDGDSRAARTAVLKELEALGVDVRVLPDFVDIATGRVTVNDVRPIDVTDLLGRDPVPPIPDLLSRAVTGKHVLVTGAGGSIGSELCRQILRENPAHLVLLDLSENALYEIGAELSDLLARRPLVEGRPTTILHTVLGSVRDDALVADLLDRYEVNVVFHAAAYKHVPIIEQNALAGLLNNTFGTLTVARAAIAAKVERFVLISTDKAVRPSSVMGASKRIAEMILQAYAEEARRSGTILTMVRFGNVLDSSGSVVRAFRRQIAAGGPVTVTHRGMIRYFMSIPEAASLVIQAGAMARGGEVFVLEMGEPVRIDDLARTMIRLSGREVRSEDNPDGDIAITYVGLRPGEKLREELLIGHDLQGTEHPRIQMSLEPYVPWARLDVSLQALEQAAARGDLVAVESALSDLVEDYRPIAAPLDLAGEEPRGKVSSEAPSKAVH